MTYRALRLVASALGFAAVLTACDGGSSTGTGGSASAAPRLTLEIPGLDTIRNRVLFGSPVTITATGDDDLSLLKMNVQATRDTGTTIPKAQVVTVGVNTTFKSNTPTYSTTFNVHGVMAAWLFIGLFCLLKSDRGERKPEWMFASGFIFSLCAAMDHGTVFFYAAFGAMLVLRREKFRNVALFVLPACLTLLPTAAYYYLIGGSIKPFATRPELFAYQGSYWTNTDPKINPFHDKLTGEHWNSPATAIRYGLACLFGPHGFLVYNPLLVIAIAGIVQTIRRRMLFWREAAAIACGSAVMMTYYFLASTNFGGWSYSVRWFVSVLFLWWFFVPAAADLFARRKLLTVALATASVVYAVGGVANPWTTPDIGYSAPFVNIGRKLGCCRQPLPAPVAPAGTGRQ